VVEACNEVVSVFENVWEIDDDLSNWNGEAKDIKDRIHV